jgi:glycosyltransferase involved in cell wall biosynthesis
MRRRILILIKGLGRGGAEQIVASSAPHFDRDRFEYHVAYLLPWKDSLVGDLEAAGLQVHCLGRGTLAWIGRLRRLVTNRRIDLIHAHSPVSASFARVVLGRKGPEVVYTEHNVWERYHPLTYWANAVTFGRNAHVFAVSHHVLASMRYPRPLARRTMPPVETLYHGIDRASLERWTSRDGVRRELDIPEDAPLVGTVANFKTHKRLDLLLRAAVKVRHRMPEVRFVLVGQGPLERDTRALAGELGLNGTVVFTGFREDAPRIASAFDVFAMSSEYEGLSIAVIEALALGKPAVVTRVGGLPEVVEDGREGLVVPPGDPDALASGILRLLGNPELRARMGEAGRRRAEAFDIRRAVARTEQVYERLLR